MVLLVVLTLVQAVLAVVLVHQAQREQMATALMVQVAVRLVSICVVYLLLHLQITAQHKGVLHDP